MVEEIDVAIYNGTVGGIDRRDIGRLGLAWCFRILSLCRASPLSTTRLCQAETSPGALALMFAAICHQPEPQVS